MDAIRAKVRASRVQPGYGNAEQISLDAVYSSDPNTENYDYATATPSAHFDMVIQNPAAQGFFVYGEEYIVTFEPAKAKE